MLKCKCLSCHCFALSGKRNYYSGDQHKFPGSECQKQAKMQSILDVKCKLCCDISGVSPEVPTSFLHNNIKYFLSRLIHTCMSENHTEKLICLLYLVMIHIQCVDWVTSMTMVATSAMLRSWKYPCKIVNVSSDDISPFGSHRQ